VPDTRGRDHYQRCYVPVADGRLDPTERPGDDVGFSIAAKEQPANGAEPSGLTCVTAC
jgi:hypothetical protein